MENTPIFTSYFLCSINRNYLAVGIYGKSTCSFSVYTLSLSKGNVGKRNHISFNHVCSGYELISTTYDVLKLIGQAGFLSMLLKYELQLERFGASVHRLGLGMACPPQTLAAQFRAEGALRTSSVSGDS